MLYSSFIYPSKSEIGVTELMKYLCFTIDFIIHSKAEETEEGEKTKGRK